MEHHKISKLSNDSAIPKTRTWDEVHHLQNSQYPVKLLCRDQIYVIIVVRILL